MDPRGMNGSVRWLLTAVLPDPLVGDVVTNDAEEDVGKGEDGG